MSCAHWRRAAATSVAAFFLVGFAPLCFGEVLYSDGFGDGDKDNNGEVLGRTDVDMDRNALLDPVGGLGSSYEPDEFPGTMVTEISSVLDSNDTGIRWLHSRGWSSQLASPPRPPEYDPKANIKIMDDSLNMMPDSTHPTYPVPSFDTGYALGYDSKGRGGSATAFFGSGTGAPGDPWQFENVALGPEVGDQVKVSFDFRVWLSGPAANAETPPRTASLRFGLFQDTDNQIGMTNGFAGMPNPSNGLPTAAVWGEEGGHFRGDLATVGATEDHGWYTHIDIGQTDFLGAGAVDPADFTGIGARINEETNETSSGGRFLEGSDNDFVAKTDETNPTFTALDVTKAYNLALTLERATDEMPGDTIRAIYTVRDLATGMEWSMEGTEPVMRDDGTGNLVPDGISSDNWDYFAIRNTTPLNSDGDDFDFLLDNFMLEIFGSTASDVDPDFDNDGNIDCVDVDALVVEIVGMTNNPDFDLNGDTVVTQADLTEWLAQAGAANLPSGNSYLVGDADLNGAVDGADFILWNSNKFQNVPAYCSGDFNADGAVDGADFILWNGNKFQSADSVNAVPEPACAMFWLVAAAWIYRRRR